MPIRFRCPHCTRLLGIARRKAGTRTNCPQCGQPVDVPTEDAPDLPQAPLALDDLDDLVNPAAQPNGMPLPIEEEPQPEPARPAAPTATRTPPRTAAPKPAKPRPQPKPGEEPPLFEADVDAILGMGRTGERLDLDDEDEEESQPRGKPGAKPVSGMDAMSLEGEAGKLVLSPQKATLLAAAVVVLLGVAFAAGFLLASRM